MPWLTSLLFNKQPACSCECHSEQTNIIRPISWLSKWKRRSSSTSSTQSIVVNSSIMTESDIDINEKKLNDFSIVFDLAVDEIRYATEFQGSIYYDSDLMAAKEAVSECFDMFQSLREGLPSGKSFQFEQKWSTELIELKSRLEALPFA